MVLLSDGYFTQNKNQSFCPYRPAKTWRFVNIYAFGFRWAFSRFRSLLLQVTLQN